MTGMLILDGYPATRNQGPSENRRDPRQIRKIKQEEMT